MNYEQHKIYTSKDTTPRQRRLAAEKQARQAQIEMIFHSIIGGILLVLLFLVLNLI